ncbi:MAG: DUF6265 family protein [Betaproteobacteria bacterium]
MKPKSSIPALLALCLIVPAVATAQTWTPPSGSAPSQPGAASPLQAFAWLAGCWEGKVNQREFREEWLPLKGDIMVGASQTAMQGKTQTFEYLRIEPRADGIYYVPSPSGRKESAFKLAGKKIDGDDEIFTFENISGEFPQRILYRHAAKGWLFAHVGGQVNGETKEVIYPMQRVDCQSGEFLHR